MESQSLFWIYFCELVGTVGAVAFGLSGFPQAIKSYKSGTSRGMSGGTVALWLTGEVSMLLYAVMKYSSDWILLGNYALNLFVVSVIAWYWLFERNAS